MFDSVGLDDRFQLVETSSHSTAAEIEEHLVCCYSSHLNRLSRPLYARLDPFFPLYQTPEIPTQESVRRAAIQRTFSFALHRYTYPVEGLNAKSFRVIDTSVNPPKVVGATTWMTLHPMAAVPGVIAGVTAHWLDGERRDQTEETLTKANRRLEEKRIGRQISMSSLKFTGVCSRGFAEILTFHCNAAKHRCST